MAHNKRLQEANSHVLEYNINQLLEIAQRLEYGSERQQEWQEQKEKIQNLLQNKTYHIAVIGEFKTGKSSFLNAMVRDPKLLKIKAGVATTAAATFLKYGDPLDVEVTFDDRQTYSFRRDQASIRTFFQKFKDMVYIFENKEAAFQRQVQEFIERLTTFEYEMSDTVQKIKVLHPSAWLQQGLVLVDTPGTDVEEPHHRQVTERICQKTDACILLFPAKKIGSKSYFDFLRKHIPLTTLNKFFFIINQADIVLDEEESIEPLAQKLRQKIRQELPGFPVEDVKIYPFSAKKILDGLEGKINDGELRIYQDMQAKFETDLRRFMELERDIVIQAKACDIEQSICLENKRQIADLQKQYNQKLQELESKRLPNLHGFVDRQSSELTTMLKEKVASFKEATERDFGQETREITYYVTARIDSATDIKTLRSVVDYDVANYLSQSVSSTIKNFEYRTNKKFEDILKSIAQLFHTRFADMYHSLKIYDSCWYGGNCDDFLHFQYHVNAYVSTGHIFQKLPTMGDIVLGGGIGAAGGAAVGAGIGSIIPGVGTAVGAVVGGILGSIFGGAAASGPSLDDIKKQVRDSTIQHVGIECSKIYFEIEQSFSQHEQNFQNFMASLIRSYSERYQETIDRAIEEQKRKEQKTYKKIKELEAHNTSLHNIDEALKNLAKELQNELDQIRGN